MIGKVFQNMMYAFILLKLKIYDNPEKTLINVVFFEEKFCCSIIFFLTLH